MTEKEFREQARIHAGQDFLEILLFYFYEHRTELTPYTMAQIFVEEFAEVAFGLAKEMNEDDDDYTIPTKKDLTSQVKEVIIKLEREEK